MHVGRGRVVTVLLVVMTLLLALAASAGARPGVGTADAPVMLGVMEGVDTDAVEQMATALEIATGLYFEVESIEYGRAGIDWLCDTVPDRGLHIMSAQNYVIAKEGCDAKMSWSLRRFGNPAYWTEILVPRDSDLNDLSDLDGLTWAYSDAGSTSGYMVPSFMFAEAGITPGDEVVAGSHPDAVLAVYNGDVDFATTFFSPPWVPDGTWDESMSPDIPDDLVGSCVSNGGLYCDGWRVLDARASIRNEAPDVIEKVRILAISPPVPNDGLAFGPGFPGDLRVEIERLMVGFSNEMHPAFWVWEESLGAAYSSDGWVKTEWPDFHFVRDGIAAVSWVP